MAGIAEQFVDNMLDLMRDDFRKLPKESRHRVAEILHDRFAEKLGLNCSIAEKRKKKEEKIRLKPEVEDALEQGERILELCDEMPERGEDFADSVSAGCREVMAMIEERNHVTADQQRALDNWEDGLSRWIH